MRGSASVLSLALSGLISSASVAAPACSSPSGDDPTSDTQDVSGDATDELADGTPDSPMADAASDSAAGDADPTTDSADPSDDLPGDAPLDDATERDGTQSDSGDPLLMGVAVLGDSNSDEYRADDNRGGAHAATTLNWMEQLSRFRDVDFGEWGARSSPRRDGYAYNWALSGATADSMLSDGQHTGAAAQIAAGEVALAIVYIGANDFLRDRYDEIYSGALSDDQVADKVDDVVADITTAVDTLLDAGPVTVVVVTLGDYSDPLIEALFAPVYPDAAGRARVTEAVRAVNAGLEGLVSSRGVIAVSSQAMLTDLAARAGDSLELVLEDEAINLASVGNEPHNGLLEDGHAGTILNGVLANWIIRTLREDEVTAIASFTDLELLQAAGLEP